MNDQSLRLHKNLIFSNTEAIIHEKSYVPVFGGVIAGALIFSFVVIIVAMFIRYNYRLVIENLIRLLCLLKMLLNFICENKKNDSIIL